MITCDVCGEQIDQNSIIETEPCIELEVNGQTYQFCDDCYIGFSNKIKSKEFKELVMSDRNNF